MYEHIRLEARLLEVAVRGERIGHNVRRSMTTKEKQYVRLQFLSARFRYSPIAASVSSG